MPGLDFRLNVGRTRSAAGGGQSLDWNSLDARLAFVRASAATRIGPAGFETVGNDAPRFECDPVSLAPLGLRIEDQRTNALLHSNDLSGATWVKSNLAVTPAALSLGGLAFSKVQATATAAVLCYQVAAGAGAAGGNCFSFFARKGSGATHLHRFTFRNETAARNFLTFEVNWDTGAVTYVAGAAGVWVADAGSGVWCVRVFDTADIAPGDGLRVYLGTGSGLATNVGDFVYLADLQLEAGAFASSYVPTAEAAATRAGEFCSTDHADFVRWLAQPSKTVAVRADSPASGTRRVLHAARAADPANDFISLYTSGTAVKATAMAGGVVEADLTLGTIAAGTPFTVALSLAGNELRASLNGAPQAIGTAATVPVCDKLWFGSDDAGNQLCGHLAGTWRFEPGAGDVEALAAGA